jgi:PKD domain
MMRLYWRLITSMKDRTFCTHSRPTSRLRWLMAAAVAVCAASIVLSGAAQIFAQEGEEESPTPMATPESMTLPSVGIIPYPGYGTAPLTVGFVPEIHDPGGSEVVAYKWNFGDGHVATTPPLVTYNTYMVAGTYLASLTITTADGRSATGFASVTVKAPQTDQSGG